MIAAFAAYEPPGCGYSTHFCPPNRCQTPAPLSGTTHDAASAIEHSVRRAESERERGSLTSLSVSVSAPVAGCWLPGLHSPLARSEEINLVWQ
ncbi:hypothetical protein J6590_039084 [Homalodisca vitripennis]|nr:hypothetical protein J6590_039084 [Homalodisca vitripennis]